VAGDVLRETNAASLGEVVSPRSLVVKLCQIDKGRLKALAAVEPKDSDDHDQPASSSHRVRFSSLQELHVNKSLRISS